MCGPEPREDISEMLKVKVGFLELFSHCKMGICEAVYAQKHLVYESSDRWYNSFIVAYIAIEKNKQRSWIGIPFSNEEEQRQ